MALPEFVGAVNKKGMHPPRRHAREYQRDAAVVTVGVLTATVLLKAIEYILPGGAGGKGSDVARALVQQAKQWYMTSLQDRNAQLRYQHITIASAYLEAARRISSDRVIENASRIDVHELQTSIQAQLHSSSKDMAKKCPNLRVSAPPSSKAAAHKPW